MKRISILNCQFSALTREKVDHFLLDYALSGRGGYVCVSNVHTTMVAQQDPSYQEIQNKSLLTVPDGMPLVWAMNLFRPDEMEPQDRVRGPDLMRRICVEGVSQGVRHYLIGGSEKALQELQSYLKVLAPGIQVVGAESPPYRPFTMDEYEATAQRVRRSGAHFLWVGLGAPKQEYWMYEQRNRIPCVMMGVGAAFDLLPGLVPEAPQWMQNAGLEWVYRFLKEPRRLWRRYLWNNPAFLVLVFLQILKGRLFSQSYLCEIKDREEMGDL